MRGRVCGGQLESRITDLPFKVGDSSIVILRSLPVLQRLTQIWVTVSRVVGGLLPASRHRTVVRHGYNGLEEHLSVANLSIEMPDDLARSLEGIAAAQRKSIQQLALERLISFVEDVPEYRAGSPTAVLRAMQEGPHPTAADVEELDALIAAGRLPIRERDLFSD